MFSLEDFWKILDYLSGKSVPELDSTIKSLADSDRTKTTSLFENTIDQVCFSTEDYKRIRKFLIDWYSGLKTEVTLGRNSHDPFVLPAEYLNELIRSFGYLYPADIPSINTRTNFFLDLVNLYKIKGTPFALRRALDYNGLQNVDLAEYWLQKNESGELVFKGVSVFPPIIQLPFPDVPFKTASGDPHWFQTEQDIIQLLSRNILALPSKTPYFGLRPYFSLSEVQQTIAILVRMVADQYELWKTTSTLHADIKSDLLSVTVSLLECYLACIYIVVSSIDYQNPPLYGQNSYLCYDGTSETVADIITEYETITSYPDWNANDPEGEILFRQQRTNQFYDLFTRQNSQNFIKTKSGVESAGDLLNTINHDFKVSIDYYLSAGRWLELLLGLMQDLSAWVRVHINTDSTDIISIVLGIEIVPPVSRIVNFFKPYRARLLTTQFLYTIDNPLFDYVRIYDRKFDIRITKMIYDHATANSLACCSDDIISCSDSTSIIEPILYSREFYDCGSYHDIGIVWDQPIEVLEWVTLRDSLNCHIDTTSSECWYWYDATSACDFWGNWMDIPPADREDWMDFLDTTAADDVEMIVTGGFRDFDACGVFDCVNGDDLTRLRLMPPVEADFYAYPLSGYNDGTDALEVQFYDLSIGLVRYWDWTFGEGGTSIEQNPLHLYFSPRAGSPVASWTSVQSGIDEISFTNTSIGPPTSFLWDFGDGEISTDENPVHVFPKDDVYLVKLIISNAVGNSTTENCVVVES